jgi:putative ABC transport system substrate-binding protein
MSRREFITLLGCAATASIWPLHGRAQQTTKIYRIGFLWESPKTFPDALDAFRRELHRLGYIEGSNLTIEFRWAEGNLDLMRKLAEELVRLQVDVIVAPSSVYTAAAKQATSTIPIVFMSHADPLRTGHVASLARPGGNITGFSLMMTETNVKSLQLMREALPNVSRVAVLYEPATPSHGPGLKAAQEAGPTLGLNIQAVAAPTAASFQSAFSAMRKEGAQAVLVLSTPLFINSAKELRADLWRRGAGYVDKVLKGTKPADLVVQQPTKFDLVVNLTTAKALGLTLPTTFLAQVSEVVE